MTHSSWQIKLTFTIGHERICIFMSSDTSISESENFKIVTMSFSVWWFTRGDFFSVQFLVLFIFYNKQMLLLKSPKEKSLKIKILIRTGLCLFFQNPVGSYLLSGKTIQFIQGTFVIQVFARLPLILLTKRRMETRTLSKWSLWEHDSSSPWWREVIKKRFENKIQLQVL